MDYEVVTEPRAELRISEAYSYLVSVGAEAAAEKLYRNLRDGIRSLARFPQRCSIAQEAESVMEEVRLLLVGKNRACYRILFRIDEEKKTVFVLTVRRATRQPLSTEDIAEFVRSSQRSVIDRSDVE